MTKLFTTTTDWVRQELTFPADTTGALDDDNALSMFLSFWLTQVLLFQVVHLKHHLQVPQTQIVPQE